jgi:hypothetical protein
MAHQQRNVIGAVAQWRQLHGDDTDAVIQIFPECFVHHLLLKRLIGRREDADVDFDRVGIAHPAEFPVLKKA